MRPADDQQRHHPGPPALDAHARHPAKIGVADRRLCLFRRTRGRHHHRHRRARMVHRHTAALHRERGWLSAEHPWFRRHRQHSRRAGRRDHDHLHRLHPAHDAWRRLHHEPTQIRALRHRRPQPAIRLAAFRPVRHPRPYRRGLTDALDTGLSAYGTSRNHQFPPRRSAGRHHHDGHLQTAHRPIHHAGDQQTRQRRVLYLHRADVRYHLSVAEHSGQLRRGLQPQHRNLGRGDHHRRMDAVRRGLPTTVRRAYRSLGGAARPHRHPCRHMDCLLRRLHLVSET